MNGKKLVPVKAYYLRLPILGEVPLSLSEICSDLKKRDDAPVWAQFSKYAFFGASASVLVMLPVMYMRAFHPTYLDASLLGDREALKVHKDVVMVVGFVLANVYAYITNRMFVFSPGKHHLWMEFFIFIAISAVSFLAGKVASDWFIDFGVNVYLASVSFMVASALINYVARKYIVFVDNPVEKK